MRERQLANLLIQMGMERGMDIEQVVQEMAGAVLPAFVDARAFRAALVEVAEGQLRSQMEERLSRLRQQLAPPAPVQGRVQLGPAAPSYRSAPAEREHEREPEPAPASATDEVRPGPELPSDATMIWTTQPGKDGR